MAGGKKDAKRAAANVSIRVTKKKSVSTNLVCGVQGEDLVRAVLVDFTDDVLVVGLGAGWLVGTQLWGRLK